MSIQCNEVALTLGSLFYSVGPSNPGLLGGSELYFYLLGFMGLLEALLFLCFTAAT